MIDLRQLAERWLQWAWSLSWQFALLVVLVAITCRVLPSASARLRHALWLLVVVKALLPPALGAPWSVGAIVPAGFEQLPERVAAFAAAPTPSGADADGVAPLSLPDRTADSDAWRGGSAFSPAAGLMLVWLAGALVLWTSVVFRTVSLIREVVQLPEIDEGPLRIQLERFARQLGITRVPDLRVTTAHTSPYLIGIWNVTIVLPQSLVDDLDEAQLRTVLLHELLHWRRRDTWIGCLQVVVQGLLWFHPLAWWANSQLRFERENVVDADVIRHGNVPPQAYGETILRVLTSTRARSRVIGSLAGVFERGARLQQRLEQVMTNDPANQMSGKLAWAFLTVFAVLFVPMGAGPAVHTVTADDDGSTPARVEKKTPYPVITETSPEAGAIDVPAALDEIRVTFDRDMAEGMSWTGGPPLLPQIDESRNARWIDKRTCVLPVKLEKGRFYRVGINAKSFQNFKSADGVPTPPVVIVFVTEGATRVVQGRVRVPEVMTLAPANNSENVPASTSELKVTFDMPMDEGMSWTGGGEAFPEPTAQARWSRDGRTCTLPVKLKPGHSYHLGLNSLSHNNFQSKWGVPLEPVVYEFRTAAE